MIGLSATVGVDGEAGRVCLVIAPARETRKLASQCGRPISRRLLAAGSTGRRNGPRGAFLCQKIAITRGRLP